MKKVLIISYFSPPCNLTSANRIKSWIKYLPESNIKPILITRKWTGKELTDHDRLKSTNSELEITKNEQYEIHKLPYRASLRDQFFIKGQNNTFFKLLSKVLTFFTLILQNFSVSVITYNNIFYYSKEMLKKDSEIETLIISGNPFEQFFFGFLLKKDFPHIKWIADYRDEWTTHYLYNSLNSKNSIIKALERSSEKKWLAKADIIQTVCPYFAKRLEQFHKCKVEILPNGFDTPIIEKQIKPTNEKLYLLYAGTLYPNQKVEMFLKSLLKLRKEDILVHFVGAEFTSNKKLIKQLQQKGVLLIDSWVEKSEIKELMLKSDGFLMFPFNNMKGWPSSKLYDYLPYQKPILLCPSDNDIIEEILVDTSLGIINNSKEELEKSLQEMILQKKKLNTIKAVDTIKNVENYSRRSVCKKMSKLIINETN